MSATEDIEMEEILPPDWEHLTLEGLRTATPAAEDENKENCNTSTPESNSEIKRIPECVVSIAPLATANTTATNSTSGRAATLSTSESTTSNSSSVSSGLATKYRAGTIITKPKKVNKFEQPTVRPIVGPKGLEIEIETDGSYSALQIVNGEKGRVKIDFDPISKRWLPMIAEGHFATGWSHIRHKGKFDQFIAERLAHATAEAHSAKVAEQIATTMLQQQQAAATIQEVQQQQATATTQQVEAQATVVETPAVAAQVEQQSNNIEMMDTSTSTPVEEKLQGGDSNNNSVVLTTTEAIASSNSSSSHSDRQSKKQEAMDFVTRFHQDDKPLDGPTIDYLGSLLTLVTTGNSRVCNLAEVVRSKEDEDEWVRAPSRHSRRGETSNTRSRSRHDSKRSAPRESSRKCQERYYSHSSTASKRPRKESYSYTRAEAHHASPVKAPRATVSKKEEEEPQGEVIFPADILGSGDTPRVNPHNNESFHRNYFTEQQWERKLDGFNRGTECLFCGQCHYSDECPYYPLAKHRAAVYHKHNRCLGCRGYHHPLPCTAERQRKICTFEQCEKLGLVHDRLFCNFTKKERERATGHSMPIGYDARRAPSN